MLGLSLALTPGNPALSASRYAGHNGVVFDGTSDVTRRGAGIWSASIKYFTAFVDFTTPSSFPVGGMRLWQSAAQFNVNIDGTGVMAFACSATGIASNPDINGGALSTSTRYRLLIALKGESTAGALDSVAKIWLSPYGTAPVNVQDGQLGTQAEFLTVSGHTNFAIGGLLSGSTTLFQGTMWAAWITGHNSNSAHYISDPTKFFGTGDVDLGTDGSLPGVQPLVFFGGRQTKNDWNAGTNLGTAGAFTMAGDGVA